MKSGQQAFRFENNPPLRKQYLGEQSRGFCYDLGDLAWLNAGQKQDIFAKGRLELCVHEADVGKRWAKVLTPFFEDSSRAPTAWSQLESLVVVISSQLTGRGGERKPELTARRAFTLS